jgi:hypothetical protein
MIVPSHDEEAARPTSSGAHSVASDELIALENPNWTALTFIQEAGAASFAAWAPAISAALKTN